MANESNIKDELKALFKEHDYNQLYYKQDIVTYQINGTTNFYQAIRNVPRYVPITDRTYWNQLNIEEDSVPIGDVDYLCFTAQNDGANLCLAGVTMGVNVDDVFSLEYSTDKANWEALEFNVMQEQNGTTMLISSPIEFAEGDKVYFRGDNINGTTAMDYNSNTGYMFVFTSTTEDPSFFAVSGDLQTIVDKTGQDKEHGNFGDGDGEISLFIHNSNAPFPMSLYITTAPDLTATTLLPTKYANLFNGQAALTKPANMPSFTTSDLPSLGDIPVGCFANMYDGCDSLEEPADFNDLTITSQDDVYRIGYNLQNIYKNTHFNITDNNGETLNGFAGLTFPYDSLGFTSYDFADSCLNNTNGFGFSSQYKLNVSVENGTIVKIDRASDTGSEIGHSAANLYYNNNNVGTDVTIYLYGGGNSFNKWQISTDGTTFEDYNVTLNSTKSQKDWDQKLVFTLPDHDVWLKASYNAVWT